jgi:hypothetical protein
MGPREAPLVSQPPPMPLIDFSRVGPQVGGSFPGFELPDQAGRLVDLHAERAGRPALVVFQRSARW